MIHIARYLLSDPDRPRLQLTGQINRQLFELWFSKNQEANGWILYLITEQVSNFEILGVIFFYYWKISNRWLCSSKCSTYIHYSRISISWAIIWILFHHLHYDTGKFVWKLFYYLSINLSWIFNLTILLFCFSWTRPHIYIFFSMLSLRLS